MSRSLMKKCAIATLSAAILASAGGIYSATAASNDDYFVVDTAATMQQMDGWGTSLAWWANATGDWTMMGSSGQEKREELANLAFSQDGLNLNILRYNIGAGDDMSLNNMADFRLMPVFKESEDADYDWSADANQLYYLQKAQEIRMREQGRNDMINEVFANSAPYWMTISGSGAGGVDYAENLELSRYDDFAAYFLDVVAYLENELHIPIDYLEPLNEPGSRYWQLGGGQEGMQVDRGEHQSLMYTTFYDELVARGLEDLYTLTGADETSTDEAAEGWARLSDEAKAVIGKINYHTYSRSGDTLEELGDHAYGAARDFSDPAYTLWMSEVCYGAEVHNHDDSMNLAFEMASNIRSDLYQSNASAWIIWQFVESELSNLAYGNQYGLLHGVYQDWGNTEYGFDMDALDIYRGDYYISRQYYALGQFSKYIKQGYYITQNNGEAVDMVSAVSPRGDQAVVVLTNNDITGRSVNLKLDGFYADTVTYFYGHYSKSISTQTGSI